MIDTSVNPMWIIFQPCGLNGQQKQTYHLAQGTEQVVVVAQLIIFPLLRCGCHETAYTLCVVPSPLTYHHLFLSICGAHIFSSRQSCPALFQMIWAGYEEPL